MKNFLLTLALISICLMSDISSVQAQDWQWAKTVGGASNDHTANIATDANGNSYVTGVFYSASIVFGTTTLTNAGTTSFGDVFVVKYDASGTVLWAKKAGGTKDDQGTGISVDASGNSYVSGYFGSSTIVFGGTTLTNANTDGTTDIFIVKYDPSGTVLWAKSAGGTSDDQGSGISIDGSSNSYITGYFSSATIAFGTTPSLTNIASNDFFIAKYDASGTEVWAKSVGGNSQDVGKNICTDASGNSYVAGNFYSTTIVFGSTTLTGAGVYDVFIVKYDVSGTVQWAKSAGASGMDLSYGISADASGNCYVTGNFVSPTLVFGGTTLTNASASGTKDFFIAKYDASGTVLWAKNVGGVSDEVGKNAMTDAIGNIYVTGNFFSASITAGTTTLTNAGITSYSDIFLIKYDPSGTVLWAQSVGGTLDDQGIGMGHDANGMGYLAGHFASASLVFSTTTLTGSGSTSNNNFFISKFDLDNALTAINKSTITNDVNIYPNPFSTSTTVSFNKVLQNAKVKIVDMAGKEMNSFNFSGDHLIIEKGELKEGIYFIQVISENEMITNKKAVVW